MSSLTTQLYAITPKDDQRQQQLNPNVIQLAGAMARSAVCIYNIGGLDLANDTLGPDDCWIQVNPTGGGIQVFLLRPGDALNLDGDLSLINAYCGMWGTTVAVAVASAV